jgi:hypothetical protein
MRKFWSILTLLVLTATLAACGGAGGAFETPGSTSSGPGSSSAPGGSSAPTGAVAAGLAVTASAPTIPSDGSSSVTITAFAKNDNNVLISGVNVCFMTSSGAVTVTGGVNGCVSTDAGGTAVATLSVAGDTSLRVITVTATAGTEVVTTNVQVVSGSSGGTTTAQLGNGSGTSFVPGVVAIAVPNLSAGGTTSLQVSIVDQSGTLYTANPVTVSFNSPCVANQLAVVASTTAPPSGVTVPADSVVTTTGVASATYTAQGCSGPDPLTASATVGTQSLSAAGTVTIAAASIGSIQFVSATPTQIGLKGTGLNETSTVVFKVLDSSGGPRPGVTVNFALNTVVGGLTVSPASAQTVSDGTVQTTVSSGTAHTAVRVTASIATPALSTQSSQLTVTTGLPTSGAFSIAVGGAKYGTTSSSLSCPNVEAWSQDGVTVPITVHLSDRYDNPVPQNTAVAFTTDTGQITGSCVTGATDGSSGVPGACSVTWTSSNPRPYAAGDPNYNASQPAVKADGRGTILATTIGEESFVDTNGNGFYDPGEPFDDLGEPYLDASEAGHYILGDPYIDFNDNGVRDPGSGSFVGITCTGTGTSSSCTQGTLAIGVSNLLIMSTSNATITPVSVTNGTFGGTPTAPTLTIPAGVSTSVVFNVEDLHGNSMAAGTSVTISADPAIVLTPPGVTQAAGTTSVGCDSGQGGQGYPATFTTVGNTASGNLTVVVTSPSGSVTSLTVPVSVQ